MKNKPFFCGWYFRMTLPNENYSCSFVVGLHYKDPLNNSSFIQFIDNRHKETYFIKFPFKAFQLNTYPFYIQLDRNIFTKDFVYLNIKRKKINLQGLLAFDKLNDIHRSLYAPTIMGPFSYLSFMECYHSILSLKHDVNGVLTLNNKRHYFHGGIGYIEGDAGHSFPKDYIWLQCNTLTDTSSSFMCSIAHIPFLSTSFTGHLCVLKIKDKEYRFTTYNGSRIRKYLISPNEARILLQKGSYRLLIQCHYRNERELIAPSKGLMERQIYEGLNGQLHIKLYKKNTLLFRDHGKLCAVELSNPLYDTKRS